MNFTEFKRTAKGRTCKLIKREVNIAGEWRDVTRDRLHNDANQERTIYGITTKYVVFHLPDGNTPYAKIEGAKSYTPLANGFMLTLGSGRLTYEWTSN